MSAKEKREIPSLSRQPSVLIVDGDDFLRKGLEYALQRLDVKTVVTVDSESFLLEASLRKYDVYLIDLQLDQGRAAIPLVERMRTLYGPDPRIMMISTVGDTETIQGALRAGANDFALEPLDRTHLAVKLSRYFSTPAMIDEAKSQGLEAVETHLLSRLLLNSELVEVNEVGLRLETEHWVSKGTTFWLSGDLVDEISGDSSSGRVLGPVKVMACWKLETSSSESVRYSVFGEFDRGLLDTRWIRKLGVASVLRK